MARGRILNDPFSSTGLREDIPDHPYRALSPPNISFNAPTLQYSFQTPDQHVSTMADRPSHSASDNKDVRRQSPSRTPAIDEDDEEGSRHSHHSDNDGTPVLTDAGIHALNRISINDAALAPKPFHGTEQDAERTEQWIQYFETYTKFRDVVGDSKVQLF